MIDTAPINDAFYNPNRWDRDEYMYIACTLKRIQYVGMVEHTPNFNDPACA